LLSKNTKTGAKFATTLTMKLDDSNEEEHKEAGLQLGDSSSQSP